MQMRSQTPEQQKRTWGLKGAKRRRVSQDMGEKRPSSNTENFSYLHFKGLTYFFKGQMIERNQLAMENRNEAIPPIISQHQSQCSTQFIANIRRYVSVRD